MRRDLDEGTVGDDVPDRAGDPDADLATSFQPLRIGVDGPTGEGRRDVGRRGTVGDAEDLATGHSDSSMSGIGSLGTAIEEPYVGPRRGESWILVLLLADEYEWGS